MVTHIQINVSHGAGPAHPHMDKVSKMLLKRLSESSKLFYDLRIYIPLLYESIHNVPDVEETFRPLCKFAKCRNLQRGRNIPYPDGPCQRTRSM